MKKIVYVLFAVLCMMPKLVNAECKNEDRERLQKLADNITYELEEYDDGNLMVTFSGISDDVRIFNPKNWMYYRNVSEEEIGEVSVKDLIYGTTYRFEVHSATKICLVENFRTITINIPNKNPYYGDSACNGIEQYRLCQKFVDVNMTYEEFVKNVEEYKSKSNEELTEPSSNNKNDNGFAFLNFYNKYYWPTFAGMICLLFLLIVLWVKQNKKNKL